MGGKFYSENDLKTFELKDISSSRTIRLKNVKNTLKPFNSFHFSKVGLSFGAPIHPLELLLNSKLILSLLSVSLAPMHAA